MEKKGITLGGKKKARLTFNAPVTLTFTALCCAAFVLGLIFPVIKQHIFSVYRAPMSDPLTYLRLFGHVLGHKDLSHIIGNMMYILLLGPLLEEKYGAKSMILSIAVTAVITGVACMLFSDRGMLGASGVVFSFILMASFTAVKEKEIPLTTVLVAVLYIGQQIYNMISEGGNVAYGAHILGGVTGGVMGWLLNKRSAGKKTSGIL